jgi:hypothetical protein
MKLFRRNGPPAPLIARPVEGVPRHWLKISRIIEAYCVRVGVEPVHAATPDTEINESLIYGALTSLTKSFSSASDRMQTDHLGLICPLTGK